MDKIRLRKLREFLLNLDEKIKQMRDYLAMEMGDSLIAAIVNFEEENAEFLRLYTVGQEELSKRKQIIQCLLFPILPDNKICEILEYHFLEPIEAGLDIEELMRMRAITSPELLWPKLSQEYQKALMQNTQIIGSNPLATSNQKDTYLPYIKNWISLYNRRFGIDKHTGMEPHQFVLEDSNAQSLPPKQKEKLLKVLKFYESLKVYSLSEIEAEIRKIQAGMARVAPAFSTSSFSPKISPQTSAQKEKTVLPPTAIKQTQKETVSQNNPTQKKSASSPESMLSSRPSNIIHEGQSNSKKSEPENFFENESNEERIKITGLKYQKEENIRPSTSPILEETVTPRKEIINDNIGNFIEKYPALAKQKITSNNIRQSGFPLGLTPSIQNWIVYYLKECGKGKHSPQERNNFIDHVKASQDVSDEELLNMGHIFRSVDDKSLLPYDKIGEKILFEQIGIGRKLDREEEIVPSLRSMPHTLIGERGEGEVNIASQATATRPTTVDEEEEEEVKNEEKGIRNEESAQSISGLRTRDSGQPRALSQEPVSRSAVSDLDLELVPAEEAK